MLYCILFLHQTTTALVISESVNCCIASSFYIKPQLSGHFSAPEAVVLHPLSTSNHNTAGAKLRHIHVVLHPLSTSNHNLTSSAPCRAPSCIASSFYIKPQRVDTVSRGRRSCIASSFYIKPQQTTRNNLIIKVVLHPLSTSNHNSSLGVAAGKLVVLHPLSTSNHNIQKSSIRGFGVVLHPLSTSNHNLCADVSPNQTLYCILFLHQTTTNHFSDVL